MHFSICIGLVLIAGMMSGLTMGLMSLDLMNLKILKKSGTAKEKKYAKGIIPLVKRHHLLLVSLLLANAAAMEALPIFLEHLVPPFVAIICSVTLVLAFGEIIPQAICTRYGLAIGYYLRYVVWGLIGLEFILAYPIGKLLDCLIGHEGVSFFRRAELSELVSRHGVKKRGSKEDSSSEEGRGPLNEDEVRIIRGALGMREKTCGEDVYTPLADVFSLELNTILDREILAQLSEKRHSRIPIYRKHPGHIIGIILTKRLIHISPEDRVKVSSLELTQIPRVTTETPLYNLLNQFQKGKSHMALVLDPQDNLTVKGVVTLEDVIEQLLESEIFDEFDLERKPTRNPNSKTKDIDEKTSLIEPENIQTK
uniref:CNNM transmembrane domain-containing protein n=1 Tax=Arcella intermedia TaxID=1963864 RepID=A0A6B2L7I0_9EUKA